jgi:hypothetical protein
MIPAESQRMQLLCQQIATEQDHTRFVQLVQELNDLLDHKEPRLVRPGYTRDGMVGPSESE